MSGLENAIRSFAALQLAPYPWEIMGVASIVVPVERSSEQYDGTSARALPAAEKTIANGAANASARDRQFFRIERLTLPIGANGMHA